MDPATVKLMRGIVERGGFVLAGEAESLVELGILSRLDTVLVRCHEGRASVGIQDLAPLVECVTRGGWGVRDVSLGGGTLDKLRNALRRAGEAPAGWRTVDERTRQ